MTRAQKSAGKFPWNDSCLVLVEWKKWILFRPHPPGATGTCQEALCKLAPSIVSGGSGCPVHCA